MAAGMYNGLYVNESVLLLFGVCIFLTFLSPAQLSRQHVVIKVGGGDRSSINVTHSAARVENNGLGSFGFKDITGGVCSNRDISVREKYIYSLSNGIPAFSAEIMNTCVSGCAISDIHISCGAFASAVEVNAKIFRRLAYGHCLVNDGMKLEAEGTVSFSYANSFMYPLSVASVKCDA